MNNITVDEVIFAGACPTGIRSWFRLNSHRLPEGYTMRKFLAEGVSVELATSLNDPILNRVLSNREAADEQQHSEG